MTDPLGIPIWGWAVIGVGAFVLIGGGILAAVLAIRASHSRRAEIQRLSKGLSLFFSAQIDVFRPWFLKPFV